MTKNNFHNHRGEENIFIPAFAMWCNPAFADGWFLQQAEPDGSAHPLLPPFLLYSPKHLAGLDPGQHAEEKTTFFISNVFCWICMLK